MTGGKARFGALRFGFARSVDVFARSWPRVARRIWAGNWGGTVLYREHGARIYLMDYIRIPKFTVRISWCAVRGPAVGVWWMPVPECGRVL